MKLSSIISLFLSLITAVPAPITDAGLREYMAQRTVLRTQQRLMRNNYHRIRRPNGLERSRAICIDDLLKKIYKSQNAAQTMAKMIAITNRYKNLLPKN